MGHRSCSQGRRRRHTLHCIQKNSNPHHSLHKLAVYRRVEPGSCAASSPPSTFQDKGRRELLRSMRRRTLAQNKTRPIHTYGKVSLHLARSHTLHTAEDNVKHLGILSCSLQAASSKSLPRVRLQRRLRVRRPGSRTNRRPRRDLSATVALTNCNNSSRQSRVEHISWMNMMAKVQAPGVDSWIVPISIARKSASVMHL